MAEEEKTPKNTEEQTIEQVFGAEPVWGKINPKFLRCIFEPDDEGLSKLTDSPLNQINAPPWVADDQVKMMALYRRKAYYHHRRSIDASAKMYMTMKHALGV